MSKESRDGLNMDSFFMIDEKNLGLPISARIIQILAVLIGGWGFISVFNESLLIPVNSFQVNASLVICTGIMALLFMFPSYNLVKLFFSFLFYGLFFFSRLPRLENGFYILENLAIDRITSYYNCEIFYFFADNSRKTEDTTLLVIMLLIPIIALLAITVIRSRFKDLCCIILFLPIIISFLFGLVPSEKYLVAYLAVILYLSRAGISYRSIAIQDQKSLIHRINSRVGVYLSIIGIAIFFILKLFVTEKGYDKIVEIRGMKNNIQTALMDFSAQDIADGFDEINIFKSSDLQVGGLSGGRLGRTGTVDFADSEQLLVKLPTDSIYEGFYLKGYVGSDYTGSRWEEHSRKDWDKYKELFQKLPKTEFVPVNQTYQLLDRILNTGSGKANALLDLLNTDTSRYHIYQGKLEVEYKDANKKYIYAPYFTNYEALDRNYYEQDLYSVPKVKSGHYEFNYYFNLDMDFQFYSQFYDRNGQLKDYSEYEKLYRDYVYQVYTKLPDKGLERLKEDFSKGKMPIAAAGIAGKIEYVKNYLESNTKYTLSPGKLPKDKDFVEYFLYENKKGYCTHYASAAVLMLRAMGVPARYVEGYAVGPRQIVQMVEDSKEVLTAYTESGSFQYNATMAEVPVMDYNAHAWVEVYIDGCGFIPVEFTPGSAIQNNYETINRLSHTDNFRDDKKDTEPVPSSITPRPTKALEKQDINKRTTKPAKEPSETVSAHSMTHSVISIIFGILFFIILVAAAAIFLLCKTTKRTKLRNTCNRNKRAVYLFMEIEKMLSFGHNLPSNKACLEDCEEYVREHSRYFDKKLFVIVMDTVKKARYGKNSITFEELKAVEALHRQLYEGLNRDVHFIRKLSLKIILLF